MAIVEVAANGAIYVDDHRITDRSTKPWGGSSTVFYTKVDRRNVVRALLEHGHSVNRIDDEYFAKQVKRLT